jgi:hypothetical protein
MSCHHRKFRSIGRQNDYNVTLDIDGGAEGRYWLYFKVDLYEHSGDCIQPLPPP